MALKTIWENSYGWIGVSKPAGSKRTTLVMGLKGCAGEPIAQFVTGGAMSSEAKAKWFVTHIERMLQADGIQKR